MARRRLHYEQAFEHYLRANRVPYVAVDEAKKALVGSDRGIADSPIKSFDFVVSARDASYLVDVKGRMYGSANAASSMTSRRYESWVTEEDIDGLERWQALFGAGFTAVFVFAYCLRQQPPDALFEEIFSFDGRWYALRSATLQDYRAVCVPRSRRWGTVHVRSEVFERISRPFSVRGGGGGGCGGSGPVLC